MIQLYLKLTDEFNIIKNYSGSTLNYIEGNVVFLIAILEKFQAPLDNLVLFEIIYYALGTDLALVVQWL